MFRYLEYMYLKFRYISYEAVNTKSKLYSLVHCAFVVNLYNRISYLLLRCIGIKMRVIN